MRMEVEERVCSWPSRVEWVFGREVSGVYPMSGGLCRRCPNMRSGSENENEKVGSEGKFRSRKSDVRVYEAQNRRVSEEFL